VDSLKIGAKSGRYREIVDFYVKNKSDGRAQTSNRFRREIEIPQNYFLRSRKNSRRERGLA
jgi:hypothetical protein